jgi:hypothetical protein
MDLLMRHLGVQEEIIQRNFDATNGCHIKYHELQAVYMQNKDAAVAAEIEGRPMEEIVVLRERCIKAFCCFWCVVPFSAIRARIIVMLSICNILRT